MAHTPRGVQSSSIHRGIALENPPVSDEPIDVPPMVFEIADDEDDEEAGTTDVEPDLKMSAMYDATTKWV